MLVFLMERCRQVCSLSVATSGTTRRSGFTLIELAAGLIVLAIILAGAGSAFTSSFTVSNEVAAGVNADNSLRRVYQQIVSEMRFVDTDSFVIANPSGSSQIGYQSVVGWDGANPVLGPIRNISYDKGTLMLDGAVLASNLSNVEFSLDSGVVSVNLEFRYETTHGGISSETVRTMNSPINR